MTSTTTGLPDRYRPIDQVAPDEETATGVIRSWRARDRVLNRDVALRVHTPGGPAARTWITRALTAGGLATPALAMVYDAAEGSGSGGTAYVVNEWLEGVTLRDRLAQDGPLPEREACTLVRRLAEGVAEAHRVGLAVGGLTPDHVVLRPGGLPGLVSVPAATGTIAGDIAALGELLELALTGGSSPDGTPPDIASPDLAALVRRARSTDPASGLSSAATMVTLLADRPRTGPQEQQRPDALSDSGWLRRMRERRDVGDSTEFVDRRTVEEHDDGGDGGGPAGPAPRRRTLPPVPARVDRTGEGRWRDAEEEDDLDWESTFAAEAEYDDEAPVDPPPPGRSARRRLAMVGLPLLALALVVAFAFWFGKNVIDVASSVDEPVGSTPSVPSSSAPAPDQPPAATTPAQVTAAELFNPFGDGEPENDDDVPLTYDGDPATTWSTVNYRGSAAFGNLKPGVGVVYDLGTEQALAGVRVTTTTPGATVEVRTGPAATGDLDAFPVAASGTLTGTDELAFDAPVTTRWVLVWVTGLVPADDGFNASIAEVAPLAAT